MTFRSYGGSSTTVSFGSPSGDVAIGNAETEGTSTSATRADHIHAFPTAATGAGATDSAPGDAEADGTATTASRSDHVHGREAWGTTSDIGTGVIGTAAGAGSTGAVADSGHTHLATAYGTTSDIGTGVLGTAAAAGSTGTVADAGHTHLSTAWASTVTTGTGWGDPSSVGTGTAAARDDHAHGTPPNPTGLALELTGATAATRLVGATTSGAPTTGTFDLGDFVIDQTGKFWICTTAGSPGTWTEVGGSSTVATYIFQDGPAETLSVGTTSAVAMTGTSSASSTSPIRVHNLALTTSAAGNNGTYTVKITGTSSGDVYFNGFLPAIFESNTSSIEPNQAAVDLIVDEPLEITSSSSLVYQATYSVGNWTSI